MPRPEFFRIFRNARSQPTRKLLLFPESRDRTWKPKECERENMNRIYQGRVTAVEFPGGKDEHGKPLDIDVLWRHHELFQDAVNYYLLALLSLARNPTNPATP